MKKILAMVLSLVLVCGLAVAAAAAGFDVSADSEAIQAGDTVTVTVTLDEDIADVTQVQLELGYDWDVLTYDEGNPYTLGEGYDFLTVTVSGRNPVVKISWIDLSGATRTLPAGTVISVPFTAKEVTSVSELELTFEAVANGETLNEDTVSVTVCPGHEWYESDRNVDCAEGGTVTETCYICGAVKVTEVPAGHTASEWPDTIYEPADSWPPEKIVNTYYCQDCGEVVSSDVIWVLSSSSLPSTCEVAPGETVVFQTWQLGGLKLGISGSNFTADLETSDWYGNPSVETYTPVDGVAVISIPEDMMIPVYVKLTNTGSETATYDLELIVPVGHYLNPVELQFGENTAVLEEGNYMGYYYSFEPTCVGTLSVTASGDYWHIAATNYGPSMDDWSDDWSSNFHGYNNEFGDTITVDVKPGDIIEIWVWAEDEDWNNPASTITVNATVEYNHEGHLVHVEAVEPGCHFTGNVEHWYCANCETVWTDAELTQVSNHMSVIVPELGGEVVHVEAKDPTCYEDGNIEHWYCETCEQVWQDEARTQLTNHKNVILGATGHQNIVHMEAVEPGCHYTGNIEHWYCTDCDTVWTDAEMTQISNHLNVIIPATGEGNVAHIDAVDPGCHMDGNIEYWVCYTCEQVWQDEALTQKTNIKNVVLPATGEGNLVHFEAIAPGCHMDGNIEYWVCYTCEQVWQDEALTQLTNIKNVVLPAVGGDVIHVEAKDATCAEDGCIEHWYCEQCELVWQDEACTQLTNHKNVIIAATGHVYGEDGVCTVCGDNPKAGDTTISLVVAAAVISAMSIVALPVVKKHF